MYALTKSGKVWCTSYFKLHTDDRLEKVVHTIVEISETKELNDVIQIESGTENLLFLKKDGTILEKGSNYYGMEDYDDNISKEFKSITKVKRIEANYDQFAVFQNYDSVDIWGKDHKTNFNLKK
jgi:alpha-tubulin suppressor-like RCC1 family protein